ncbi:MAG TPA: TetR/AcrR family transcriptional regulator [Streptosporangiales bacterium]
MPRTGGAAPRPHTGRRRNEAARQAILAAAADLVGRPGAELTVDAIAAAAGVGKQTIYRWWPSKYAILLEAMVERARAVVPVPDTGTLDGDLTAFLEATFAGARERHTASMLRTLMAEAQRDPKAAGVLREFTEARRAALRDVVERGRERGETAPDADLDLLVEQVFGVLWYRIMVGHAALDAASARRLAAALLRQVARLPE